MKDCGGVNLRLSLKPDKWQERVNCVTLVRNRAYPCDFPLKQAKNDFLSIPAQCLISFHNLETGIRSILSMRAFPTMLFWGLVEQIIRSEFGSTDLGTTRRSSTVFAPLKISSTYSGFMLTRTGFGELFILEGGRLRHTCVHRETYRNYVGHSVDVPSIYHPGVTRGLGLEGQKSFQNGVSLKRWRVNFPSGHSGIRSKLCHQRLFAAFFHQTAETRLSCFLILGAQNNLAAPSWYGHPYSPAPSLTC